MSNLFAIRRPRRTGFIRLGLAAVALAAVGLSLAAPLLVQGQSESPIKPVGALEISPRIYTQVRALRDAVGLSNGDLATLDMSSEQTVELLADLVTWVEGNQGQLIDARARVRTARRELRATQRKISMGSNNSRAALGLLSKQTQALAAAKLQQQNLYQGVARACLSKTRSDQLAQWEVVHGRTATRTPTQNELQLASVFQEAKRDTAAVADNAKSRGAEHSAVLALRQTRKSRTPGVIAAEQLVLPVPAALSEPLGTLVDEELK